MARKQLDLLPAVVTWFALSSQLLAEDGFYWGTDLGPSTAPGLDLVATDNDWSTKCDRISNPTQAETGDDCATAPPPSAWVHTVNGGRGMLTGIALGYRRGNLRVEGEYSHRTTTYGDYSQTRIGDVVTLAKADQELEIVDGGVDDLLSHDLFANLSYDFVLNSRLVPYAGVGIGSARVWLDFFSRWTRNDDPEQIQTFKDPMLRAQIAGTTTIGKARLSDTVTGYRLFAGVDYQASDPFRVGLEIGWVKFGDFEGEAEWLQLRSHESSVGRGARIRYRVMTDGLSSLGISLNLKHRL